MSKTYQDAILESANLFKDLLSINQTQYLLTKNEIITWEAINYVSLAEASRNYFTSNPHNQIAGKDQNELNNMYSKIIRNILIQKLSDKLFQKFKENTLIQRATNTGQSLQIFSDFLGIPCDELQDKLGDERLNSYVSAFAQTMEEFNEQTEENPPPDEDTKTKRNSARKEIMEGLKRRVLGLVKLKLPSSNFPERFEVPNETDTYINVQGYVISLKQIDGYSLYEKSINENYLETLSHQLELSETIELSETKKTKFIESFTKHRDSIDNFDEMFFFHYHQKASSIKATYKEIAREFKKEKSEDEIKNINTCLQTMISNVDKARNEALNEIQKKCKKQFNECLKKSIKSDGSIDIKRLNTLLNKSIKMMKKESDVIFKNKLHVNQCPLLSSLKRNATNAFGGETCMKSTSGGVTTTIQSTPITAHAKGMGPAMSKITMEKDRAVVHQSYRTSHLVSDVEESPETVKERIAELVENLSNKKTVIYSLYTSVYNRTKFTGLMNSALLIWDEPENHQTQRLEILLKAQDEYNQSIRNFSGEIDYSKLFFTFNTPTNGYGEEINLQSTDPLIKRAAQSNIVAMAIALFGVNDEGVESLINAYISNDKGFNNHYYNLRTRSASKEWPPAKKFLFERFKDDDAATHQHAKITATCMGIISDGSNFTLMEGCKSGLERTGNILGRVESYHKDKANEATQENLEEQEQEKIKMFTQKLHSDYNENGLYGASSCLTSLCDQGGNPKTSKTSDRRMFYTGLGVIVASLAISLFIPPAAFGAILGLAICLANTKSISPDTNRAEDRAILTHYESSKMSTLQAHKDKNFDGLDESEIELMKDNIEKQLTGQRYMRFVPSGKSKFVQLKSLFRAQQKPNSPEEHDASFPLEHRSTK